MPKKRTREQKMRAQYQYTIQTGKVFSASTQPTKTQDVLSLYSYDPKYMAKDIRWTVIVSFFILAIQLGLYFWLR